MSKKFPTDEWKNTARLYALVAPKCRTAVILRRGPTGHVRMILWDMEIDQFTLGQWMKKRVYERRCDLSPDGTAFVYFAADHGRGLYSWTAISRPPYFTALSLWQKGDCWGGGGLFSEDGKTIKLNHRVEPYGEETDEMALADGFENPTIKVEPLHERSGWGEDDPICYFRMIRDGWVLIQEATDYKFLSDSARNLIKLDKPTIYEKMLKSVAGSGQYSLRLSYQYHGEVQGRSNVEEAIIVDQEGAVILEIGRVDWCNLDKNGDVLWAWAGKLWRMKSVENSNEFKSSTPKLLGDFNDMKFEEVKTPDAAKSW